MKSLEQVLQEKDATIKTLKEKVSALEASRGRKHNGASDNGVFFESNRGSGNADSTKSLYESYRKMGLSHAEAAVAAGLKPELVRESIANGENAEQLWKRITGR